MNVQDSLTGGSGLSYWWPRDIFLVLPDEDVGFPMEISPVLLLELQNAQFQFPNFKFANVNLKFRFCKSIHQICRLQIVKSEAPKFVASNRYSPTESPRGENEGLYRFLTLVCVPYIDLHVLELQ